MVRDLAYVTAHKLIEAKGRGRLCASTIRGQIVHAPVIGQPMVILRDPYGLRISTSPVVRVLGNPEETKLYVRTANSLYILRVRASRNEP